MEFTSRQRKFRAWDGEKMHYDYLVARPQWCDVLHLLQDEGFAIKTYGVKMWKVTEFTGIRDKGGEGFEAYEGDVIGRTSFPHRVIVWHECGFYTYPINNPLALIPLIHLDDSEEIIGNIFQNPNFLL